MTEQDRADFETAMGESFGDYVAPPIPFESASPHECCEAIWSCLGRDVTPELLASLDEAGIARLARAFGEYFESPEPSSEQIRGAISSTLGRWPPGSLDETE
jgi:hypothetical protein